MQTNGTAHCSGFPSAAAKVQPEKYRLALYITGMTARSAAALTLVRALCDEHLEGRYQLEVIDLYEQPALARTDQIIASPTLVKRRPLPQRRLIGDLSNRDRVLVGLGL
jgi:circadian clock protein KaiB